MRDGIFLNQRPRILSYHFWHPPRWGAHKPNRVLAVHADLCLSALTGSEPLVRTGAQVGCHCHNRSGYTPTAMLIFIARSFPRSWRMDARGSQVSLSAPILLHTCVLLFNFQVSERLFLFAPLLIGNWERHFVAYFFKIPLNYFSDFVYTRTNRPICCHLAHIF